MFEHKAAISSTSYHPLEKFFMTASCLPEPSCADVLEINVVELADSSIPSLVAIQTTPKQSPQKTNQWQMFLRTTIKSLERRPPAVGNTGGINC